MKMFIYFIASGLRSYLLHLNGRVAERPQHMIMRVAIGIHGADIDRVLETCLNVTLLMPLRPSSMLGLLILS